MLQYLDYTILMMILRSSKLKNRSSGHDTWTVNCCWVY